MGIQATLKALADPVRREILELLKVRSMTAGEISERFPITGAAISRHLSILREADLVRCRRKGKYLCYELNATILEEVLLWISCLKGGTEDEN